MEPNRNTLAPNLAEEYELVARVNREQAITIERLSSLLREALATRFIDHIWCVKATRALTLHDVGVVQEKEGE